uniref:G-protein coupled receptors family 1 profile domain-containing protein n=1 Tax=Nannospalax galili TaxID=1026970 RepID=A0A8C6RGZ7_NANGA
MQTENTTVVKEFILLGLTQSHDIQLLVLVLILVFYLIIFPGIVLIIFTIRSDPGLTALFYFFLGNLACLNASYSFIVAPRMLVDFSLCKIISYKACITQLFFLYFLGGGEGLLLVVMAFDHYVAICWPLYYSTVMSPMACYMMLLALWFRGFVHSIIQVVLILCLPFCGPNHLDNFCCDVPYVIKLACADTSAPGSFQQWPSHPPLLPGAIVLLGGYIISIDEPVIYTLQNQEVKTSMKKLLSWHIVC